LEQTKSRLRKVIIFGIALLVLAPFLTRRNHRFYIFQDGELIPVEFEGGMMGGMAPPPGMMGPYGQAPYPGQQQQQQPGGYYRPPQPGMYPNQPPPAYNQYQSPPNYNYQGAPASGSGQYGYRQ
jgi:hypothetical protein